jgi:hypothetical protein
VSERPELDDCLTGRPLASCCLDATSLSPLSQLPRQVASTFRPRCSHSRMKSSSNPPLRLRVKRVGLTMRRSRPVFPQGTDIARSGRLVRFVPRHGCCHSRRQRDVFDFDQDALRRPIGLDHLIDHHSKSSSSVEGLKSGRAITTTIKRQTGKTNSHTEYPHCPGE